MPANSRWDLIRRLRVKQESHKGFQDIPQTSCNPNFITVFAGPYISQEKWAHLPKDDLYVCYIFNIIIPLQESSKNLLPLAF